MAPGAAFPTPPPAAEAKPAALGDELARKEAHVDPFLVECLENPRHRLIVLRMELDIQKFMQNPHLNEFEFQNFPTSYLRCAAHRVAQHYGLETMVADSTTDGAASRIIARKTPESRYPGICLSEVPSKQAAKNDSEAAEGIKFVICQRPKASPGGLDADGKKIMMKTVEEREKEYDEARARIFNGTIAADLEGEGSRTSTDETVVDSSQVEPADTKPSLDWNRKVNMQNYRSRVAVFRDAQKDRSDPDFDRSYKRAPAHDLSYSSGAYNFLSQPFVQHDGTYFQHSIFPSNQTVHFDSSELSMGPSSAGGYQQTSRYAVYPHWPAPSMMLPYYYEAPSMMVSQIRVCQSFGQLRHG